MVQVGDNVTKIQSKVRRRKKYSRIIFFFSCKKKNVCLSLIENNFHCRRPSKACHPSFESLFYTRSNHVVRLMVNLIVQPQSVLESEVLFYYTRSLKSLIAPIHAHTRNEVENKKCSPYVIEFDTIVGNCRQLSAFAQYWVKVNKYAKKINFNATLQTSNSCDLQGRRHISKTFEVRELKF